MSPLLTLIALLAMVGLMAIAAGAAIFYLQRYNSPDPSPVQERLIQIKHRQAYEEEQLQLEQARKMSRFYKDADYQNAALGQKLERFGFFMKLKILLQQAGIKTPADKYFMMNMLAPAVLLPMLGIPFKIIPLVIGGPLIAGLAYGFAVFKKGQRMKKFITQLPDALSLITSALRAGHSFQSALTVVSTELGDPISTEFSFLVRDINLGIPVKEALTRLIIKLDLPDVRMFATAVTIQREAGGNLAEVLEKLGYTIRERFKLKGQIAALTGQSRLTGYVLGGAPAVLLTGLSLFMPEYVAPLWETTLGHIALGIAVVMQLIGFFVMKKIVDIRV